jgi:hypothetical protein
MVSVAQPLPELDVAPPNAKKGWETQVGMSMKCVSGEDAGLEVRYTTTSVGGKRAVQALAVAIATQVETNQTKPVPIVLLKKEHYSHKSYGRIYTPIFDIQTWATMDVDTKDTQEETAAPAIEAPAPARRRRGA